MTQSNSFFFKADSWCPRVPFYIGLALLLAGVVCFYYVYPDAWPLNGRDATPKVVTPAPEKASAKAPDKVKPVVKVKKKLLFAECVEECKLYKNTDAAGCRTYCDWIYR